MAQDSIASARSTQQSPAAYERPTLVPVGSLHDLLMGASGTLCDAATGEPDNFVQNSTNC
jgi:hypothetical protein